MHRKKRTSMSFSSDLDRLHFFRVRPESPTGLYWSIPGNVRCAEHLNDMDDHQWESEHWQPLPVSSQGLNGRNYQCQRCAADGTPLAIARAKPRTSSRLEQ